MASMTTKRPLDRARRALAAGRYRRALNLAWEATHAALPRNDHETIEQVQKITIAIENGSSAATAVKAKQLREYCGACLGTATGDLTTPSEVARLLQRGRNLRSTE
jgi:hypothetical protein